MDFSWVKELAERSNAIEELRNQKLRQEKLDKRQLSLATPPFVEKLHLLLSTCAEEFNKYIQYSQLKVQITKLQKRQRGIANPDDAELTYPEESVSFVFSRGEWIYGIRGCNGAVEFLEIPTTGNAASLGFKLEETGVNPSRKLVAELDRDTAQIVWKQNGQLMDGQAIVALCRNYFKEFIEKSNSPL